MIPVELIGLQDYSCLFGKDPAFERHLRRRLAAVKNDYKAFLRCLYEEIQSVILVLQSNPQRRTDDCEDRLTDELVSNLSTAGYTATHGRSAGGHVDITVACGDFTWIGEAKKYHSTTAVYEGFLQLTTRYRPANGNFEQNQGGLLIYITDNPDAKKLMNDWLVALREKAIDGYSYSDCSDHYLSFISQHKHEVTGEPFIVRHIPLLLYFDPKDKSGRNRKTGKKKSPPGNPRA